jgi:glycosyltransferase involved in cell wall biosynthesis
MKFSIVIPTWNNLAFVQCCVDSIVKHSAAAHQIILHINDGADGTLQWAIARGLHYTHSSENIGICNAVNLAASKAQYGYIMYMNDDMYCLPNWDSYLIDEIQQIQEKYFMLSATMIEPTATNNACVLVKNVGQSPSAFQEQELLSTYAAMHKENWSGAFWPPNVVPIVLWHAVGGFSEEFSPGMSSDDDFVRKCWQAGCRIFYGVGKSKVYHFQGKSTQRITKNNGRKQYLQKWGITQSSFRQYYLRLGKDCTMPLQAPHFIIRFLLQVKGALKK